VAVDSGKVVVTVDGVAQSQPLVSVSSLEIRGGSGDNTFTVDPSVGAAGVSVSLDGGGGQNTYKLGDSFGDVTVASGTDGGKDTLDFTALVGR
jgi:hypothetical protein